MDERYRMLTAIAFINDAKAADAMVKLSTSATSNEVKSMAQWWIFHPNHEAWREVPSIKKLVVPTKITADYLVLSGLVLAFALCVTALRHAGLLRAILKDGFALLSSLKKGSNDQ